MASTESHMVVSVASSGLLDDQVAERTSLHVLLALHLDAEQPLEHRIAGLALSVATHGFSGLHLGYPDTELGDEIDGTFPLRDYPYQGLHR